MLNYKDLYDGFIGIMDNEDKYSENLLQIAQQWTNVFQTFYLNQIMPISGAINPNLISSLQIFKTNLVGIIQTQTWKEQFEVLVKTLHIGVCMGVDMTGIYITTPPVVPLKLQHCWNPNFSRKIIVNMLASTILTWVQSTFSTQISSGVIIKWI